VKTTADALCAKNSAITRTLLPIIALGGSLAATPAAALELGELTVQSNLGRPLRASIAYALAPNETLSNTCISIHNSASGLPGIGASTITLTERAIIIAGAASIREPMLGARVTVNCPHAPNLSREYMLFVDPQKTAKVNDSIAPVTQARNVSKTASKMPAQVSNDLVEPIGQSSRYQTKVGDTLSDIVSRIENRSMKLWPAVETIFRANPHAFIGNDPNRLKAGSWLTIPSLDGTVPVVAEAAPAPVADKPAQDTSVAIAEAAAMTGANTNAVYEPSIVADVPATVEPAETDEAFETLVEEAPLADSTNDLRAGDVILDSDKQVPEPAGNIVIPDTELASPETTSTSPNVPTAIITTDSRGESTSLITWLIGGSFAIIAGLFLLGRRVRSRFGSTPVGPAISTSAVPAPVDTEELGAVDELDYNLADESPTEENLALDVDLDIGTGLSEGAGVEVIEQFGFAETTKLDIELPSEPQAEKNSETDIIPPIPLKVESILESEILPEEDDYDMSVIMDATKMPHPEDVTERDLMAVEVGVNDGTVDSGNYTISKEVDYNILEQDYENELTATQALNEEIERAAAELSKDLDEVASDDETSELSFANVTDLGATAQLPQQDDTTAEMEIQGGKVDTRAR